MFGLLLGGLMGRAAAGAAARTVGRAAARPLLGSLMSRRQGGGFSGGGSVGGSNSTAPSEQPTTIKGPSPEPTIQPNEQKPEVEAPAPPQQEPMTQEISAGIQERPTLQDQSPQPSNPTTPVRPLEGLLDTPAAPAPPRPVAGTKIDAPQSVVTANDDPMPTATPMGDTFPSTPETPQPFLADLTSKLPPRTTFIAPDGNPSRPIDTSTKVNNSSPGYSSVGLTSPAAAAPQFSYLRR